MGSGGAKKTNQMLAEQTQRANQLSDVAGGRSAEIYNSGRGDIDWGRTALKDMYTSLGSEGLGGGGGGGGYTPAAFTDETTDFWRKLMGEGAYSPTERGAMESAATAPIQGMADMVKRGIESQARGSGVGYASGLGRLLQDRSYAASEANKSAFANIAQLVAQSKLQGATGLEDIETKRRAFEAAERARRQAAAGRASASAAQLFGEKRSLIHDILGLEGDKDLAYMDRQLAGGNQALGGINSRRDETPMWQKGLASILPSAAAAGVSAFVPPGIKKPKYGAGAGAAPVEDSYGPQYG